MSKTSFSAAEQGLGYIFQSRFALLKVLDLPEDGLVHIERNDDVEFISVEGASLASLKHKAVGDRLTDLSTDFWKSVRIWLHHYKGTGRAASDAQFLLFSTASISPKSFLNKFTEIGRQNTAEIGAAAADALKESASVEIVKIKEELDDLSKEEVQDFFGRVTIFPNTPRIEEIPGLIDRRLRTVRRDSRVALFERLEGWWNDQVIKILTGKCQKPISVQDVSDKLAAFAEEYRTDNLPINFRSQLPTKGINASDDRRTFVEQLRILGLSNERIQHAIIDYYRAFEQRSSWARESLLVSGEIEEYEDRLVEEWSRFRAIICEKITIESHEDLCREAGKELYLWAETKSGDIRIRERVTEPYVVRGAFHILANGEPSPRIYWHPWFLQRLAEILGVAA